LLLSNFVLVPVLVWSMLRLAPTLHPAVMLGVYLTLLTPCVDYVVVFTQLGGGNSRLLLATTPLLLLLQIVLLPVYLTQFLDASTAAMIRTGPFLEAFILLIVLPLALAIATHLWAQRSQRGAELRAHTAWWPVPLMALTMFVIFASQLPLISANAGLVMDAVPLYVAFMALAPLLAIVVARTFRLNTASGRALAFSTGTRNSLVVLPLTLTLPGALSAVPAIIVAQTLVELIGELVYIRVIPRLIATPTASDGDSVHGTVNSDASFS
jgi:ACR3 family arsenite efflux pump ArsB